MTPANIRDAPASNSGYSGTPREGWLSASEPTVGGPRPKRWGCTPDGGAQVVVTVPGRDVDASSAVETLRAALERARAEVDRSRNDAA
jgi:hypothetical protein